MSPYILAWQDTIVRNGAAMLEGTCASLAMRESFHAQGEIVRATYYDTATNKEALLTALNALPGDR